MAEYKTPGVYVVEKNAFPSSVVEVETAVPVFIGYTKQAILGHSDVTGEAVQISSMHDFETIFGDPPQTQVDFQQNSQPSAAKLTFAPGGRYMLYHSMRLFFDNGGGKCFVISVGPYASPVKIDPAVLWNDQVKDKLEREMVPTMVVIPEMTQVDAGTWQANSQMIMDHCIKMQSRIAILDVLGGDKGDPDNVGSSQLIINQSTAFRQINSDKPSYGVTYYPWLNTTIIGDSDVDFRNYTQTSRKALTDAVAAESAQLYAAQATKVQVVKAALDGIGGYDDTNPPAAAALAPFIVQHQTLLTASPLYKMLMGAARDQLNILPPSAAMAGAYARTDALFGVFKAPANLSLNSVVSPVLNITHDEQEDLNVPLDGKAINAIRVLPGRGLMVWGARTLDGNSQDWRYVNVRRTMIMLEQSIKAAAQAYVFQPNTASTWLTVRSMIVNYLNNKWKDGALMGTKQDEAFTVDVGLGATMTGNDILDGYMRVTIKVALVRPAEFIELTFVQQMQGV